MTFNYLEFGMSVVGLVQLGWDLGECLGRNRLNRGHVEARVAELAQACLGPILSGCEDEGATEPDTFRCKVTLPLLV